MDEPAERWQQLWRELGARGDSEGSFLDLARRPFPNDVARAEIDRAIAAVDRDPLAFIDDRGRKPRATVLDVDFEPRASDDTGLP